MSISNGFTTEAESGLSLNVQAFHGAAFGTDGVAVEIGGGSPDLDTTMTNENTFSGLNM